jgi:hypothetical protein
MAGIDREMGIPFSAVTVSATRVGRAAISLANRSRAVGPLSRLQGVQSPSRSDRVEQLSSWFLLRVNRARDLVQQF